MTISNAINNLNPPQEYISMSTLFSMSDRELGRGANGRVIEGKDLRTSSPVAIKIQKYLEGNTFETDVLEDIRTPHTIHLRDVFDDTQNSYMVMDLIPENNIEHVYIKGEYQLPLNRIISIARQLLEFLGELHRQNVIYMDLKPGNLIYRWRPGSLTVIDFGGAEFTEDALGETATLIYSSPEILLRGDATPSHDYWSLACTLYALVTRRHLFKVPKPFSRSADHTVAKNCILQLIAQQIGKPSAEFLSKCQHTGRYFNQEGEFINKLELPERGSWQDEIRCVAEENEWPAEDIEEFINIIGYLLCYENRETANPLLSSRLFEREIVVHLTHDSSLKCKMSLHRVSRLKEHFIFLTPAELKKPDVMVDFNEPVDQCLHVPRDPEGCYALILEKDGVFLKEIILLDENRALDISPYQYRLIKQIENNKAYLQSYNQEKSQSMSTAESESSAKSSTKANDRLEKENSGFFDENNGLASLSKRRRLNKKE